MQKILETQQRVNLRLVKTNDKIFIVRRDDWNGTITRKLDARAQVFFVQLNVMNFVRNIF